MNRMTDVAVLSLLLLAGAASPLLKAADSVLQKTGYVRELAAMRETLEFSATKVTQFRDVYDIPEGFGKLIGITPGGDGVVMWFQNEAGEIRNVSLPVTTQLIVKRKGKITIDDGING